MVLVISDGVRYVKKSQNLVLGQLEIAIAPDPDARPACSAWWMPKNDMIQIVCPSLSRSGQNRTRWTWATTAHVDEHPDLDQGPAYWGCYPAGEGANFPGLPTQEWRTLGNAKEQQTKNDATTANLAFEAKLWAAADALRNHMDASEQYFICHLAASSSSGKRTTRRLGAV